MDIQINDLQLQKIAHIREREILRNRANYLKRKELNITYYKPKGERKLKDITELKIYKQITEQPHGIQRGRPRKINNNLSNVKNDILNIENIPYEHNIPLITSNIENNILNIETDILNIENNIKLNIEHTPNDVNISLITPNIDNIETTPNDVNISLIPPNIDNIETTPNDVNISLITLNIDL